MLKAQMHITSSNQIKDHSTPQHLLAQDRTIYCIESIWAFFKVSTFGFITKCSSGWQQFKINKGEPVVDDFK